MLSEQRGKAAEERAKAEAENRGMLLRAHLGLTPAPVLAMSKSTFSLVGKSAKSQAEFNGLLKELLEHLKTSLVYAKKNPHDCLGFKFDILRTLFFLYQESGPVNFYAFMRQYKPFGDVEKYMGMPMRDTFGWITESKDILQHYADHLAPRKPAYYRLDDGGKSRVEPVIIKSRDENEIVVSLEDGGSIGLYVDRIEPEIESLDIALRVIKKEPATHGRG